METIECMDHQVTDLARLNNSKKVWIDLDNSPHVPLFAPIIQELRRSGHSLLVTARDCFQVTQLANLLGLQYALIGRHYGQNRFLKVAGLCIRTAQLAPTIIRSHPDVALSHGSRAQLMLCAALRIPSVVMMDYEFAAGLTLMRPSWVILPEAIPGSAVNFDRRRILKYPGIKEDVYVPTFQPMPGIRSELGVSADQILVTIRPPASEAHYHNPESELLLDEVMSLLSSRADTKIILLPRNQRQEESIRRVYPHLFSSGKVIVPPSAVHGLNLIWYSDLVISGGGTMNREAAALGVPVYSIFRGKLGAVDRFLSDTGRLVLIERPEDIREKIVLRRRSGQQYKNGSNNKALTSIVQNIETILTNVNGSQG